MFHSKSVAYNGEKSFPSLSADTFFLRYKTHLDFRRKNFGLVDVFFLLFPFTASSDISHFNFDLKEVFRDFDTPKSVQSLDVIVVFDDCNFCCFFDVVKLCKKLNITLRVIAHSKQSC